jgi:hypothetical protein
MNSDEMKGKWKQMKGSVTSLLPPLSTVKTLESAYSFS